MNTRFLCLTQGLYFMLTGIWPWVSMSTFEMVTGPKTDDWLVKTVGALVIVVCVVLFRSVWCRQSAPDTVVIGAGTAGALMMIDLLYASQNIISKIYLADAAVEFIFVMAWAWVAAARLHSR
jgi:hypothetical protein